MRNGIIPSLIALGLTLGSAAAQAQDPEAGEVAAETTVTTTSVGTTSARSASTGSRGPLRVYGGFHLGGGGNLKAMPDVGDSEKTDMGFLGGLQGGVDYVIHPYVALGGEFRFTRTRLDLDLPDVPGVEVEEPKFTMLDFVFKPRGRYEFSNIPLEVYGTLPLGFDFVIPSSDNADTKFNMNLGIGAGASYFFTERMGVNTELLGIFHWFRQDSGFDNVDDTRFRVGQFYWLSNFVYVL